MLDEVRPRNEPLLADPATWVAGSLGAVERHFRLAVVPDLRGELLRIRDGGRLSVGRGGRAVTPGKKAGEEEEPDREEHGGAARHEVERDMSWDRWIDDRSERSSCAGTAQAPLCVPTTEQPPAQP